MSKVTMPEPVAWATPDLSKLFGENEMLTLERFGGSREKQKTVFSVPLITTTQAEAYADARVREAQQWVSVDDRMPNDGDPVMFVVDCKNPNWDYLHGMVLGGHYRAHPFGGGFGVPGLSVNASHWMPLPAPPTDSRPGQP